MEIGKNENLEKWKFEKWKFGKTEIWKNGNFEKWKSQKMKIGKKQNWIIEKIILAENGNWRKIKTSWG